MKKVVMFFILVGAIFCGSGCIQFYESRDYKIKVIDQDSREPIQKAKIVVNYAYVFPVIVWPSEKTVMTGKDGVVDARLGIWSGFWRVSAIGYTPINIFCSDSQLCVPELYYDEKTNEIIFPLCKDTETKIEIVVPDGYRGPVAIDYVRSDRMLLDKAEGGVFTFYANENGYIAIQSSLKYIPILWPGNIVWKYNNGNEIKYEQEDHNGVGIRFVVDNVFVVGTEKDLDEFERRILLKGVDDSGTIHMVHDKQRIQSYIKSLK